MRYATRLHNVVSNGDEFGLNMSNGKSPFRISRSLGQSRGSPDLPQNTSKWSQGICPIDREVTCTDILIYQVMNGQFAERRYNYDIQWLTQQLGVIKA